MSIVVVNDPQFPAELYEIFFHSSRLLTKNLDNIRQMFSHSLLSQAKITSTPRGTIYIDTKVATSWPDTGLDGPQGLDQLYVNFSDGQNIGW
uniref:Uncharacterized protein n=1 Tax=Ditylenchus dipsaci TaxID=166011 RepID=A0A915D8Y7_9BILA